MVRMLTFPKLGTKYLGILGVQTWESFVDSRSTRLKLEASVLDYEVLSFVACFPLCVILKTLCPSLSSPSAEEEPRDLHC